MVCEVTAGQLNVLEVILNLIGSLHLAFDFGDEAGNFQRRQLQSRHKFPSDTLNVGRGRVLQFQSRHPIQQRQKTRDIGDMDPDGRIELDRRLFLDCIVQLLPPFVLTYRQTAHLGRAGEAPAIE